MVSNHNKGKGVQKKWGRLKLKCQYRVETYEYEREGSICDRIHSRQNIVEAFDLENFTEKSAPYGGFFRLLVAR